MGNEWMQADAFLGMTGAASGDHPTQDGDIELRPACMVSGGHEKSQESRVQEEGLLQGPRAYPPNRKEDKSLHPFQDWVREKF